MGRQWLSGETCRPLPLVAQKSIDDPSFTVLKLPENLIELPLAAVHG